MLIDEAQDFAPSWFRCALAAVKELNDGDLLIVGDGSQGLYRGNRAVSWEKLGTPGEIAGIITRRIWGFTCPVLGNAGLGLSTEGLIVILRNNTSVELNVRLVELTSNDGSRVVRLLHDRDSVEGLPVPLHIGEERVTASKKYSTQPQGPTRESGMLPPHTRGNWLLTFDLVDLVTFVPRAACCTVDYLGPDGKRHVLRIDISRGPHLAGVQAKGEGRLGG